MAPGIAVQEPGTPAMERTGSKAHTSSQNLQPPEPTGEGDDSSSYDIVPLVPIIPKIAEVKKRVVKAPSRMDYSDDQNAAKEFFKKEPCIHTHRIFDRAAKIFEGLKKAKEAQLAKAKAPVKPTAAKGGKLGALVKAGQQVPAPDPPPQPEKSYIPPLDFLGPVEKKLTFELAFSALKYQNVFDDMLDDCAFYSINGDLRDYHPQVSVVLYDYQSRKFQPRTIFDNEEISPIFTQIEKAILAQKTKLAASLARRRIKASAPSIEYLLPDNMRGKSGAKQQLPTYCWVNTLKISPTELLQNIRDEGFVQMWTVPKNFKDWKTDKSFFVDSHCNDVLVFSVDTNSIIQEHRFVEQGYLVRQDKSSCLAVFSVMPLVGDEQDVIVFNPGSGLLAAHLAVGLTERKGSVVVMCCGQPEDDYNKMMANFELLGVMKHMKVVRDVPNDSIDEGDSRFRFVRAALVCANCSKSAVTNIVNYIVTEGENLKLLQDITDTSEALEDHLNHLANEHIALLKLALSRLSKIHAVAYVTRSTYEQENELVVQRTIEWVNVTQMARKLPPWRVIPPVIPYTSEEIDDQIGIDGKYLRFNPTTLMNGCFIACIAREPEDPMAMAKRKRKSKVGGDLESSGSGGSLKESAKTHGKGRSSKKSHDRTNNHRKVYGQLPFSLPALTAHSGSSSPTARASWRERERHVPEYMKVVKHPNPFR